MTIYYAAGKTNITAGSAAVAGAGTDWAADVNLGDSLEAPDGRSCEATGTQSLPGVRLVVEEDTGVRRSASNELAQIAGKQQVVLVRPDEVLTASLTSNTVTLGSLDVNAGHLMRTGVPGLAFMGVPAPMDMLTKLSGGIYCTANNPASGGPAGGPPEPLAVLSIPGLLDSCAFLAVLRTLGRLFAKYVASGSVRAWHSHFARASVVSPWASSPPSWCPT